MSDEYASPREESDDDDGAPPAHSHGAGTASWAVDWGRLLRTARQVAGLSLTELSARTGLSKGYLSKLESGANSAANPSRATLAALARALPSFRPVAHTLEPGLGTEELAFAGIRSIRPPAGNADIDDSLFTPPLQLGWREMELLAALVALDAAAIPAPATAVVLARAVDREVTTITKVLDGLVRAGVVEAVPPVRAGISAGYRCTPTVADSVGVSRLGDLLVLAAALIAGISPTTTNTRPLIERRTSP